MTPFLLPCEKMISFVFRIYMIKGITCLFINIWDEFEWATGNYVTVMNKVKKTLMYALFFQCKVQS